MGSNILFVLLALFISFNLLSSSMQATAETTNCPPPPSHKPKPTPSPKTPSSPKPKPPPTPSAPKTPPSHTPKPTPTPSAPKTPSTPTPKPTPPSVPSPSPTPPTPVPRLTPPAIPTPATPIPVPTPPATPTPTTPVPIPTPPATPTPRTPIPMPTPPATPPMDTCPIDVLRLGVCGDVLSGLVGTIIGSRSSTPCCSLLQGLTDLDASLCLCTALRANVLGINLNIPVSLTVLLNACGNSAPDGYQCAAPTPMTPIPMPTPPTTPTPAAPIPVPTPPATPTPTPTTPIPMPTPPSTTPIDTCPIEVLRLGVCGDVLSGLVGAIVGTRSNTQCCSLLQGLTDLDASVCLCTALRADVLGTNLNIPISLTVLLNACGNSAPDGFQCA